MSDTSPMVEAQQRFIDAVSSKTVAAETISLSEALGRTLFQDLVANEDSPSYNRAIVEGFIVNSAETQGAAEDNPISFQIVGTVAPGDESCPAFGEGQAIETQTGAVVPDGPVSIVRMWEAERDGDSFTISCPFPPRFFVEDKGCDLQQGSTIIAAGTVINAQHIGTLASLGLDQVEVCARPRVAIYASGNEVIPHTGEMRPGLIRDCNSPMLAAAVAAAGGEPVLKGIKSDDFGAFVADVMATGTSCDMVLISGGTAVNGRDFISDLVNSVGNLVVDGVPMRSGRPLIMGVAGKTPMVCVAGHPPEALRGFNLFGAPALAKLLGQTVEIPTEE